MGPVHIGQLHLAVTVQVRRTHGGEPAIALPDEWRHRDRASRIVKRKTRAFGKVAFHDHHQRAVLSHVDDAGSDIFEHAMLREAQRHHAFRLVRTVRTGGQRQLQGAPFDRIAEHAVIVAFRRLRVFRSDDRLRPRGGGNNRKATGQRGNNGAHVQICFSGIWTRRPSSASVTFNWQVRRDRAGSGS